MEKPYLSEGMPIFSGILKKFSSCYAKLEPDNAGKPFLAKFGKTHNSTHKETSWARTKLFITCVVYRKWW